MEELLREMEAYAAAHRVPIIAAPARSALIAAAKEQRPRRVLEIGAAIGYSTLLLAANSAPEARVTTLEIDAARADVAEGFIARSPFAGRITVRRGDALAALDELPAGYDFVFIDAAKGQYPRYLVKALALLAADGTIAADNVLFRGMVRGAAQAPHRYRTIVTRLREYLRLTAELPGFTTKIEESGDGLAVSRRRGNGLEET